MVDIRYSGHRIDTKWPSGLLFKSQWGKSGKRWYANAEVFIVDTKTRKEVGDYYGLIIASPAFIKRPKRGVALDRSFTLVMDVFDEEDLRQEIKSRIEKINASDWEDLRAQMNQYFWVD